MEKFTTKFQQALAEAQSLALGHEHHFIEPAYIVISEVQPKFNSNFEPPNLML